MARLCLIGLDGLPPDLVFSTYWAQLPHLRALAGRGLCGPLRSCEPPITVPAWAAMVTGMTPGSLGVYGFHDRADRSYDGRRLASSLCVPAPPLWTWLSRAGRRCRVLTVPQTYPPLPLNGSLVAGHPSPPQAPIATYPAELAADVQPLARHWDDALFGARRLAPRALAAAVRAHSAALFAQARAWAASDAWDFLMLVDMGPDRLHHSLWRLAFPQKGDAPVPADLAAALPMAYAEMDAHVGALVALMRPDDHILVVSDHGARAMAGGLALNQWLLERGDLVLKAPPAPGQAWTAAAVDWARTRAWADGGFVGRIHLNVVGREPQGRVPAAAVDATCAELAAALAGLPRPAGLPAHRAVRPAELYPEVRGVPPDLMVYAGGLGLRCLASLGHKQLVVADNDRGPDAANHSAHGIYILAGPSVRAGAAAASLYDVAPTVLDLLAVPTPPHLRGSLLHRAQNTP